MEKRKSTCSTAKEKNMAKIRAVPMWLIVSNAAANMRDQDINAQHSEKNVGNVAKQITSPRYVNRSLVGENAEKNGFIASKTPKLHRIQVTRFKQFDFTRKYGRTKCQ